MENKDTSIELAFPIDIETAACRMAEVLRDMDGFPIDLFEYVAHGGNESEQSIYDDLYGKITGYLHCCSEIVLAKHKDFVQPFMQKIAFIVLRFRERQPEDERSILAHAIAMFMIEKYFLPLDKYLSEGIPQDSRILTLPIRLTHTS